MVSGETKPILNFFDSIHAVKDDLKNKNILIFLDYDGTLTPIVDTPDLAILSGQMHDCLETLTQQYTVSIVSGRATQDVRSKVNISNIFYAGSHGFEIVRPDGEVIIHPEAKAMRSVIEEVYTLLSEQVKGIQGALVEDVKYTISVHYRLVAQEEHAKMESLVENILKQYPQLVKTDGKKVFELRPKIDWDKGKAVNWILDYLKFDPAQSRAIYVGDDRTDEDAFAVLQEKGFGVLVADPLRDSEAKYYIRNVGDVERLIQFFIELKS